MQIRTLGKSGIEVTAIGLGTNYVGGHNLYVDVDESAGVALVEEALDRGITFLDTADVYGTGRSEELVGKAIEGRRDEVVLATKGGVLFGEAGSGIDNSPAYLRRALHASLGRLGVDYVDLYYIHRIDGKTPLEESYGEVMRFKEEGLIRAGGLSNVEVTHIEAAMRSGPVDAVQCQYNMLQRQVEGEVLHFCRDNGISFVPWGPLAYGLLSGKYSRGFELAESDWRHRSGAFNEHYEKNLEIVRQLNEVIAPTGAPLAHVALQWLLTKPAVTSVIAGAKRPEQVADNARADTSTLDADVLAKLDACLDRG